MSAVAFGALRERLQASSAPMTEVGARYLHTAAAAFVTLGAVMVLANSLHATMLVPSRMALVLVRDGLAPAWIGTISERTGTPVLGLAATLAVSLALVLSGQVSLALSIAVFALVALYLLHSVALLLLPRWNPALFATVEAPIPLWVQRVAGVVSIVSMAGLLAIQLHADAAVLGAPRSASGRHASSDGQAGAAWAVLGLALYGAARRSVRCVATPAPRRVKRRGTQASPVPFSVQWIWPRGRNAQTPSPRRGPRPPRGGSPARSRGPPRTRGSGRARGGRDQRPHCVTSRLPAFRRRGRDTSDRRWARCRSQSRIAPTTDRPQREKRRLQSEPVPGQGTAR
jgi:hypothetical protein